MGQDGSTNEVAHEQIQEGAEVSQEKQGKVEDMVEESKAENEPATDLDVEAKQVEDDAKKANGDQQTDLATSSQQAKSSASSQSAAIKFDPKIHFGTKFDPASGWRVPVVDPNELPNVAN